MGRVRRKGIFGVTGEGRIDYDERMNGRVAREAELLREGCPVVGPQRILRKELNWFRRCVIIRIQFTSGLR